MPRPLHEGGRGPAAEAAVESFHADVVAEVRAAVDREAVVVVGMAQNPHPGHIRKALDKEGIPYTYLSYGSYFSKWKERLAIKLWSGWPTFPQVFVHGVLIGGASDAIHELERGDLKKRLEAGRGR